ncbi:MAG TPA: hypothetical protein VM487_19380 [Phycisphaerae bacterium]|nr:hypothetical protein [Phycisphaerae bacterium]
MAEPFTILGSLASIAGLAGTLHQFLSGRKKRRQEATLEHYVEWLRR